MAGGNPGFVLSSRPRAYKELPQQTRMKQACEHCNIRKGMSREELVTAMRTCLPEYFRLLRSKEEVGVK